MTVHCWKLNAPSFRHFPQFNAIAILGQVVDLLNGSSAAIAFGPMKDKYDQPIATASYWLVIGVNLVLLWNSSIGILAVNDKLSAYQVPWLANDLGW